MGYDFNQVRKPNAKLIKGTIDKLGTTYAVEMGGDGFSSVTNVVTPMPTDIKEYLEGNDNITIFACASNIDKLCKYALASFPNIEDLYLFKTSAIVVLEDDLSYLLDLNKIYVPSDLLSAYISAYPTLSSKFDTIVEDYTLTIPYVGIETLTSEYVDSIIAMLSAGQKGAITKVVIPTDFTQVSADNIAWNYNFSVLTSLDSIWYGNTEYDFTTKTLVGSDELLESDITNFISTIGNDKRSGVLELHFEGFSDMSVALTYDYSALPNLEYLWLDNVRYELISGELVNPTYFYPLTDLEQEYNANLNQTFYLDYNGTLPSYPDYQLTYYTDINRTTSILPTDLVSGTRYYVKAVMVTLVIQGSGTLTSAIVEEQIAKAGSGVTKVVVPSDFTSYANGCLDPLDNLNNVYVELNNPYTYGFNFYDKYTNATSESGKIRGVSFVCSNEGIYQFNSFGNPFNGVKCLDEIILKPYGTGGNLNQYFVLRECYVKKLEFEEGYTTLFQYGGVIIGNGLTKLEEMWFPSTLTTLKSNQFNPEPTNAIKIYIKANECLLNGTFSRLGTNKISKIYIPRGQLTWYQTNWSAFADKFEEYDY